MLWLIASSIAFMHTQKDIFMHCIVHTYLASMIDRKDYANDTYELWSVSLLNTYLQEICYVPVVKFTFGLN